MTDASFNWKLGVGAGAFRVRSLSSLSWVGGWFSRGFKVWKWPAEFELSPLTRLMRSSDGENWLTITIIPVSETKSMVQCSFYCSRTDVKAALPVAAAKREIADSVAKLELLFAEVSESGEIPDEASQEPLLAEIKAHSWLERLMCAEVHPASRMRESSQACKVADDLCRELEDAAADGEKKAGALGDLSW